MQFEMKFDDGCVEASDHVGNEPLLRRYRDSRRSGAADSTIDGDVSQLRSLARDASRTGASGDLKVIVSDPQLAARLLLEPVQQLRRSTMQTRLRALQRLIGLTCSPKESKSLLDELDSNLSTTPSNSWHDAGITVGGRKGRAKARMSVPPSALTSILHAAEEVSAESAALAGLLCFSAIRLDELSSLTWDQLSWGTDQLTCTVHCTGATSEHVYVVMPPGVASLFRLLTEADQPTSDALVFPGRNPSAPAATRTIRSRLARWCNAAGWAGATRSDLVSALAGWMHDSEIDDHSIRVALGRRYARTVDGLLAPHRRRQAQLDTQQVLRQRLDGAHSRD